MPDVPLPPPPEVLAGSRVADGVPVLFWASATDVGRVRRHNEDAVLASPPTFVVADGMGGHEAGDVASALAVTRLGGLGPAPVAVDEVAAELRTVNSLLREASGGGEGAMGTTCVGVVEVEGAGAPSWLVFNVGDSRAYCLVDDVLVRLSKDHSFVQQLVDAGEITAEEAATHRQRNVITRALGVDDDAEVDFWIRPIAPGERLLLCSDGLHGEVDEATLGEVLRSGAPPVDAVADLVGRALTAGGRDNVSVVIVDVVSVPGWDDVTTGGRVERDTAPREVDVDTAERPVRAPTTSDTDGDLISWVPPVDRDAEADDDPPGEATIVEVPVGERPTPPPPPEEPPELITAMPPAEPIDPGDDGDPAP